MYTVLIEKRHCENTYYASCTDCALARAIKEQIPSFDLFGVGGSEVINNKTGDWYFDYSHETGWNPTTFNQLKYGEIDSFEVRLWQKEKPNSEQSVQECDATKMNNVAEVGNIKTIIKYVSVPETIQESLPETILS